MSREENLILPNLTKLICDEKEREKFLHTAQKQENILSRELTCTMRWKQKLFLPIG